MRSLFLIYFVCLATLLCGQPQMGNAQGSSAFDLKSASDFLKTFCIDCHSQEDPEAGLDLHTLWKTPAFADNAARWEKIAMRVHSGQMPPTDFDQPSADTRTAFARWIRTQVRDSVCADGIQSGPPKLRRLNRDEYGNTIRDLLGIRINAGHALPADGAGGEGFDNASETLFISPIHAEKYLEAAQLALLHAFSDPDTLDAILIESPSDSKLPADAAREILDAFLLKAFRRPATPKELDEYIALFKDFASDSDSFRDAIKQTLQAALVSPKFLFLYESPPESNSETPLSHYEMASRLSYFLWSSMPDQELLKLAAAGKLHDESVLRDQVKRMLHSPVRRGLRPGAKVREFAENFVGQWLGTRALGREFRPDPSIAPDFGSEMLGAMKYEPVFFFEDMLSENKSILNWIDSDFTYVNRSLARHYGIKGKFREQPKFVSLPKDTVRGGALGMSAVLAISSRPHRTSPVLRGQWILETLLGTPPPPPPPDVGELESSDESGKSLSLREQLERHRSDPTCASCHSTMDPLGFGLENFDVLGKWRTKHNGKPVDSIGELPDGTKFDGPAELKSLLMKRKDDFARHFTRKMLGYALTRSLTPQDICLVEAIVEELKQDDYKSHTLIFRIVNSRTFRYKKADATTARAKQK